MIYFNAQIQVLDILNENKVGIHRSVLCDVAAQLAVFFALKWKLGNETGGKKFLAVARYLLLVAKGNSDDLRACGTETFMTDQNRECRRRAGVSGHWHCEGRQAKILNSEAHARLQELRPGYL